MLVRRAGRPRHDRRTLTNSCRGVWMEAVRIYGARWGAAAEFEILLRVGDRRHRLSREQDADQPASADARSPRNT
jgi:hypothetical protein